MSFIDRLDAVLLPKGADQQDVPRQNRRSPQRDNHPRFKIEPPEAPHKLGALIQSTRFPETLERSIPTERCILSLKQQQGKRRS
ncbi:hypothetical protein LIER_14863 [Lithospermum erythrorhizon]|uniref:Uncharacterized protein n=1 Tax=Lithospermum erythrorhizon TaxID=34254 RepID=A0AAV3Q296_LITER